MEDNKAHIYEKIDRIGDEYVPGIPEWEMEPVIGVDGLPVANVYKCPHCGAFSDKQYSYCPKCQQRTDPD